MSHDLFFFHHSDKPRTWTTDFEPTQQSFLWFADRFHELTGIGSKFVYFFLINPQRDGVAFTARPYGGGFHGLYLTHLMRHQQNDTPDTSRTRWNNEPPFISTYNQVIPQAGAEFNPETEEYTLLFPPEHAGKRFRLFDHERRRTPFLDVLALREIFPLLREAYPFIEPPILNDKYSCPDWCDEHPDQPFQEQEFERERNIVNG
jgi:hypothetical protein